ncbi:MAG: ATPase, T2SS/T4P/T4SS family [Candidatus Omnitrophota bacterium]|jgi:type IV pilus assembly protein PilB
MKDLLVLEGVVAADLLESLSKDPSQKKQTLVKRIVSSGQFDSKKLLKVLSRHFGYPMVNPAIFKIEPEILELVPKEFAFKHLVLPISRREKTLTVAFGDPTDLEFVSSLSAMTQSRIRVAVSDVEVLKKCIEASYGEAVKTPPPGDSQSPEEGQKMDELVKMIEVERQEESVEDSQTLLREAYETPVIKLVNMVLIEGIRRNASDIFIEPWERFVRVRVRVDGLLEEIVRPQKTLASALVSRIKIMSGLDIAEHRVPQDGRFKVKAKSREVDMRVSILPTTFGEKVCLRILDTKAQSHEIARLGFTPREQQILQDSARRPHGMILVTGPTGSGKTTTLYSVLKYLDAPEVNITTVEDPVEYQIPGINQVNVREAVGLTFPAALRSILRQDPDIILIGEIRDAPTLDIAVKAALTGHLVLSTLHTNDAASSVTRMINMGLEPFLIASTVIMISAQRLIRRICPQCRVLDPLLPKALADLGITDPRSVFYKAKGCTHCRQTGYKGRTVITELLPVTQELRQVIMRGETADRVKALAQKQGMSTLRESALAKALAGETSLEEVFRVTTEEETVRDEAADVCLGDET